jgi:RNA polymerase sigma-70 factor (ECF subfamily)
MRAVDVPQEWILKARAGDREAFSQVVEAYQVPVYNLCRRMLGNPGEAEDAAQETFWRAFQAIGRYDPQRPFATWLLSIAAHHCIDHLRRQRLVALSLEAMPDYRDTPDPEPGPESSAEAHERELRVAQMLKTLEPVDRAAIVMRYWYDLSYEMARLCRSRSAPSKADCIAHGASWPACGPSRRPSTSLEEEPMMPHPPYEEWLLDTQALTPAEAAQMDAHLRDCASCRGLASGWAEAERWLRAAPALAPRAGFAMRWQTTLAAREVAQRRWQAWLVLALALTGALALAVILGWQTLGALLSPTRAAVGLLQIMVWAAAATKAAQEVGLVLTRSLSALIPPGVWITMVIGAFALISLWLVYMSRYAIQGVRQ